MTVVKDKNIASIMMKDDCLLARSGGALIVTGNPKNREMPMFNFLKMFPLNWIDVLYLFGIIRFETIAQHYNLRDVPLERVLKFPQKGC